VTVTNYRSEQTMNDQTDAPRVPKRRSVSGDAYQKAVERIAELERENARLRAALAAAACLIETLANDGPNIIDVKAAVTEFDALLAGAQS
jgi:hypothetical protein